MLLKRLKSKRLKSPLSHYTAVRVSVGKTADPSLRDFSKRLKRGYPSLKESLRAALLQARAEARVRVLRKEFRKRHPKTVTVLKNAVRNGRLSQEDRHLLYSTPLWTVVTEALNDEQAVTVKSTSVVKGATVAFTVRDAKSGKVLLHPYLPLTSVTSSKSKVLSEMKKTADAILEG